MRELHITESKLIEREKFAGLAQLKAGIAHEIQNPLNFINNFSDLSIDQVAEIEQQLKN